MLRYAFALVLLLLCITESSFGQRKYPGDTQPKPPTKPAVKPPTPKVPSIGTLSIATNPPVADIVIKDQRGRAVGKGQSQDGKYQTQLHWGTYTIEVSADKYVTQTIGAEVERAKTALVTVQLTPTRGSLLINLGSAGPDATILLDGKRPDSLSKRSENEVELGDLTAGAHRLRITHPGIAPYEAQVTVEGGKIIPVNPMFKLAVANLRIKSEPEAGIFVDGKMEGQTTGNGELLISIPPGRHTVRAEKDKFKPEEKTDDFLVGDQTVMVNLTRIKSSPEFSDTFQQGLIQWDAPKGWQVNRSRLVVKSQGAGFVRNNVYDDFKMVFDISFANQKGAVWILRAHDKKSYYLFQLSGPKSSHPRIFRTYICQNGQLSLLKYDPLVEDLSRPNDSYQITVEAKGSTIKHYIQLKSNPAAGSELISTLTDSTFSYGGIGFAAIEDEEFDVFFVNVTPDSLSSR